MAQLKVLSWLMAGVTEETTVNLRQNSPSPDWNFSAEPSRYEAGVPATQLQHSFKTVILLLLCPRIFLCHISLHSTSHQGVHPRTFIFIF